MVRAWYMDNVETNQRLEHNRDPPLYVSLKDLFKLSGVEYFKIDKLDSINNNETLNKLKIERNYTYEDEIICSKECLPDYEDKLKQLFEEHLHTDEEIRLVLEGSGYFDVRDSNDEWIRIEIIPGDLLILPKGIYHRFTLDANDYIKAKRYFVGEPVWTPHYRPAEELPSRKEYLARMVKGF